MKNILIPTIIAYLFGFFFGNIFRFFSICLYSASLIFSVYSIIYDKQGLLNYIFINLSQLLTPDTIPQLFGIIYITISLLIFPLFSLFSIIILIGMIFGASASILIDYLWE